MTESALAATTHRGLADLAGLPVDQQVDRYESLQVELHDLLSGPTGAPARPST